MNRLVSRAWFFPAVGALAFIVGFNDELVHVVGTGWLELGRLAQTTIVLAALGLVAYLVADRVKERRSAHQTAIRAARPPSRPHD
jgi:hypothetical protein